MTRKKWRRGRPPGRAKVGYEARKGKVSWVRRLDRRVKRQCW